MARQPTPGGDDGVWGNVLNEYLSVSLNTDGTIKPSAVSNKADDSAVVHDTGDETVAGVKTFSSSPVVPTPGSNTDAANKSYVDSVAGSGAPDATTTSKGIVQLAGDLAGTAAAPTVPALSGKVDESTVTTKGDLLAASASATITRLGVGNDGEVLTADTGETTGIKWAAPTTSGDQAWQFRPETYGANGDGKVVSDVSVSNGSAVITSASGLFVSGDVGKYIMINGGLDSAGGPLITTIASYQSATQVTLTDSATNTDTDCAAVWGTDDTVAINDAVDAAKTYAVANEYFAEIVFKAKIYMVAGAPTQSTSPYYNSQIPIPYPSLSGDRKLVIAFTGTGANDHVHYWNSTAPNLAGTCLVSTQTAPSTIDVTYGPQSVIGGPTGNGGFTAGSIPAFPNIKAELTNIMVVCGAFTNQTAIDLSWCAGARVDRCSAHVFSPPGYNGGASPLLKDMISLGFFQSRVGVGLRSPLNGDNADTFVPSFSTEGFHVGVYSGDHFIATKLTCIYTDVAFYIDNTLGLSGISHAVNIEQFCCEVYNGGIRVNGGYVHVYIVMDSENTGVTYDIKDDGDDMFGIIYWSDPADARDPTVDGAGNVKIINNKRGPGHWSSPPSVPATTVAQQNTSWRDAAVNISGGTVTAIAVDGTSTGLTSGTVIVPSGKNITLTYSSAPSWNWTLL